MSLAIYTGLITCCVGGLACYHGKLGCAGQTTNEEIRGKYGNGNPYDEGCKKNCNTFCQSGTSRIFTDDYDTRYYS